MSVTLKDLKISRSYSSSIFNFQIKLHKLVYLRNWRKMKSFKIRASVSRLHVAVHFKNENFKIHQIEGSLWGSVGNTVPLDVASYPRKKDASSTALRKPKKLRRFGAI
jgi:hypothetical protein